MEVVLRQFPISIFSLDQLSIYSIPTNPTTWSDSVKSYIVG